MTKDDFEFIADRAGFILFFAAPKEKYAKERAFAALNILFKTRLKGVIHDAP